MKHDLTAWLESSPEEEVLEPELPICDPHHHLWDRDGNRYMLEELHADTGSGHRVVSTVFVECMSGYRQEGPEELRPVGETAFVLEAAEASSRAAADGEAAQIAGIVSFADLTLGERVRPVLEAHVEAGGGRFRGIRHAAGWDASEEVRNSHTNPPQGLLSDAQFRRGFACLGEMGLTFDAWLYHTQIPELTSLARAQPGVTIVLDHFGGPLGIGPYAGQRQHIFDTWQSGISELARCPNVTVKLGGLAMPINGFGWHKRDAPPSSAELAQATAPYYRHCIDAFGPERCMFESNFPVDKVSCSYRVLWNSFKRIAADFSADDKAMLFHDTAAHVYRLD